MNKTQVFLVYCLLSLLSLETYAKKELSDYKCLYKLQILQDTLKQTYEREETYVVQINEHLTKGFTYQKFHNDSLAKANPELFKSLFSASVQESIETMRATGSTKHMKNTPFHSGPFPSTLIKDYRKQEMRVVDYLGTEPFIYTEELQPQDWEILPDTMSVLGYTSQKARCNYRGRAWIAWFTTEVPISEGPWKFYGLPGLITKIEDVAQHFSFELIGFQQLSEKIDTQISKKIQSIKRAEFIASKRGNKGEKITAALVNKVGLTIKTSQEKLQQDYIERE